MAESAASPRRHRHRRRRSGGGAAGSAAARSGCGWRSRSSACRWRRSPCSPCSPRSSPRSTCPRSAVGSATRAGQRVRGGGGGLMERRPGLDGREPDARPRCGRAQRRAAPGARRRRSPGRHHQRLRGRRRVHRSSVPVDGQGRARSARCWSPSPRPDSAPPTTCCGPRCCGPIAGTAGLAALLALIAGLGVARRDHPPRRPADRGDPGDGERRPVRPGGRRSAAPGELRELGGRVRPAWPTRSTARTRSAGTWSASVAHELRTPVAVLQAGHEALLDGVIEADPGRARVAAR